ncbi:venom protease-like [Pogonomyrmex barbatus]|uniref:Venom protease-like n=1 Tax=Pogonomyrmex barbatus TaxID=144034 RepID=A0A6I9VYZ4_9HYME|nr:venom protease-like [Pogonomyrmex barbatus]XP_011632452.1 venom protease-like [Pogonomyrmex barbatus]
MSLASSKIFLYPTVVLYALIGLTICQYTQSQYLQVINTNSGTADTYGYSIDNNEIPERIAGGKFAKLGDFPYMAVVHRLVGNGVIGQCGGTIISKRWVLTAAHCAAKYPQKFFVVFGIIDKSNVGYDYLNGPGVSMITTQAYIHPTYTNAHNDIALLYMPKDIPFSYTIQPIKLAYEANTFANENAFVIGWGKESPSSRGSSRLKYAAMTIIGNDECKQYWHTTFNHICTASGSGRDACQGDSGGPLIVTKDGQDLQIGIVSYGDAFCPGKFPGVFTRVSQYINWIHAVTRNNIY